MENLLRSLFHAVADLKQNIHTMNLQSAEHTKRIIKYMEIEAHKDGYIYDKACVPIPRTKLAASVFDTFIRPMVRKTFPWCFLNEAAVMKIVNSKWVEQQSQNKLLQLTHRHALSLNSVLQMQHVPSAQLRRGSFSLVAKCLR
jgi:hypothetical protein